MTPKTRIAFHGYYGCTRGCLDSIIEEGMNAEQPNMLRSLILEGLQSAVRANNVHAATQLVKRIFPVIMKDPKLLDALPEVQAVTAQAKTKEILVPLGAVVSLLFFLNETSYKRVEEACRVLSDWVDQVCVDLDHCSLQGSGLQPIRLWRQGCAIDSAVTPCCTPIPPDVNSRGRSQLSSDQYLLLLSWGFQLDLPISLASHF